MGFHVSLRECKPQAWRGKALDFGVSAVLVDNVGTCLHRVGLGLGYFEFPI